VKVWAAWLAAGVVREVITIRRHDGTLSQAIAATFRTETPAGRATYLATLGVTAAWMAVHITRFQYTAKAGR
jgi:CHASE1-domain containing sensor protein